MNAATPNQPLLILAKALPQGQLLAAANRATAAVDAIADPNWSQPPPDLAANGAYYKPTMPWHGLTINIENPVGTVREGVDDQTGRAWRTEFTYAYGEIVGTLGVDGDPVDVFIGPYADAREVYVVRQMKRKRWHLYDEDKVMIDFPSIEAARAAYLAHYDDARFFGGIEAMPLDQFLVEVQATANKPVKLSPLLLFNKKS